MENQFTALCPPNVLDHNRNSLFLKKAAGHFDIFQSQIFAVSLHLFNDTSSSENLGPKIGLHPSQA